MTIPTDTYVPSFSIMVGGKQLPADTARAIISISITETCNQADSFTIRLREHYPDPKSLQMGRLSWIDNTAFEENEAIEIELGYLNSRGKEKPGIVLGYVKNQGTEEPAKEEPAKEETRTNKVRLTGFITGIALSFTEDGGSAMTVRGYSKYLDLQRNTCSEAFDRDER